jgi:hypothetical protein
VLAGELLCETLLRLLCETLLRLCETLLRLTPDTVARSFARLAKDYERR